MRLLTGMVTGILVAGLAAAIVLINGDSAPVVRALDLGEECGSAQNDDGTHTIMVGVESSRGDGSVACGLPERGGRVVQSAATAIAVYAPSPTPVPTQRPIVHRVPPPTPTPRPPHWSGTNCDPHPGQDLDKHCPSNPPVPCIAYTHAQDGYSCIEDAWERDQIRAAGGVVTAKPVRVHPHPHEDGDNGGVRHSH